MLSKFSYSGSYQNLIFHIEVNQSKQFQKYCRNDNVEKSVQLTQSLQCKYIMGLHSYKIVIEPVFG